MATEIELKYAAIAPLIPQIRDAVAGNYISISMETTYYDTPAGGLGRHEWELEADSIQTAIPGLCKLSDLEELSALTAGGVVPVCGARFTRLACPVDLGVATAELALDEGILFGGGRELPFAEVEVELKSGVETAVFGWAQALAARFGLKPEPKSKFRRALTLAKGD